MRIVEEAAKLLGLRKKQQTAQIVGEKKLPRAELREERLYIEGEKEPYMQGSRHSLRLTVRKLQFHRKFGIYDGKAQQSGLIQGTATIEDDRLTVAGRGLPEVRKIPVSVVGHDEEEYDWEISVGFNPGDWIYGTVDEYFCSCYVPESVFNELVKAYLMGKAEELTVKACPKLWLREPDWHGPGTFGRTWYLVPSIDRQMPDDMTDMARGNITTFSWSDRPTEEPPADEEEELQQPKAGTTAAYLAATAAYLAFHVATLGKISGRLLAILITLIVLAAILLFKY
jgi:hypothetical protein